MHEERREIGTEGKMGWKKRWIERRHTLRTFLFSTGTRNLVAGIVVTRHGDGRECETEREECE